MSIIYVSSSLQLGDGSAPEKPVNNLLGLQETVKRVRANSDTVEAILFECGSVFTAGLGTWDVSNILLGSFGNGPKPIFWCQQFMRTYSDKVDNLTISSLDIRYKGVEEANGLQMLSGGNNLVVRDCIIRGFTVNINVQGYSAPWFNVLINNNRILDATSAGGRAQGLYAENTHGLELSNNIFDKCGTTQIIQSHGAYIHALCTDLTADNNVFSRCAGTGLQARPGGTVINNTFIRCPVSLTFGYVLGGSDPTPGGVPGLAENNVIIEGCDIGTPTAPQYLGARGIGIQIGNLQKDALFRHNLIAKTASVVMWEPAVQFWQNHGTGMQNAMFVDNLIVDWNEVQFLSNAGMPPEFRFENNTVHRIRFHKSPLLQKAFYTAEYDVQLRSRNRIIEPPATQQYTGHGGFEDYSGLREGFYKPSWPREFFQSSYNFMPVAPAPEPVPKMCTFTIPAGTEQVVINIEK